MGSLFWGVPSKSILTGSAGGRTGQREELNSDAATSRPQLIPLSQGGLSSCLSEWPQMEVQGFCTYPNRKNQLLIGGSYSGGREVNEVRK